MATVVRYDDEAKLQMVDADQLLTLPILGEEGVQELIRLYEYRESIVEGTVDPVTDVQWARVQEAE